MTTSAAVSPFLGALVHLLETTRFTLATEKALQAAVGEALARSGFAFTREHRFSAKDVVDFWCPPIAIEAKLRGRKREIFRQCERYCAHAEVEGLILATTVPLNLDRLAKPAVVVNLGRAWL